MARSRNGRALLRHSPSHTAWGAGRPPWPGLSPGGAPRPPPSFLWCLARPPLTVGRLMCSRASLGLFFFFFKSKLVVFCSLKPRELSCPAEPEPGQEPGRGPGRCSAPPRQPFCHPVSAWISQAALSETKRWFGGL